MNLHLFFEGKMGCEEMTSAFLATLLEQETDFRNRLFDLFKGTLDEPRITELKAKKWTVKVEENYVDVYLEADDDTAILLLENKILAGSMQKGQLHRYYAHQAGHDKTRVKQIGAIYLAPGPGLGSSEVDEVKNSELLKSRPRDFALRINWGDVLDRASEVAATSSHAEFISSGCEHIDRLIKAGPMLKWPRAGERQLIYDIVSEARARLCRAFPDVQIGTPWANCDCYTLSTHKTNVTMWLSAYFNVQKEPPHHPVGLVNGDQFCFETRAQLRLAVASRRVPHLRARWTEETVGRSLEIGDGASMPLDQDGWANSSNKTKGTREEVIAEFVRTGSRALQHLLTYQ